MSNLTYKNNYDLLAETSDETQLYWLDKKLIALWEERRADRGRRSRFDIDIEEDIKDIEFRRKLLLEKMNVTKMSQNQFSNSQVHFGVGDNIDKNKIENKHAEKRLSNIIISIAVGLAITYLTFKFGWQ